MSHKRAKSIRKEIGYKPSAERKYVQVKDADGRNTATQELDTTDKRSLYQEMKKGK